MTSQYITDFLANKDEDHSEYIPQRYRLNSEQKKWFLFREGLESKFFTERAAQCTKTCFKDLDSSVVSQAESDCMTNCTSKALETLSIFQLSMHGQQ